MSEKHIGFRTQNGLLPSNLCSHLSHDDRFHFLYYLIFRHAGGSVMRRLMDKKTLEVDERYVKWGMRLLDTIDVGQCERSSV